MPFYVLNRNYGLITKKSHHINFAKGVPQYVPPELVPDVVAIGAESVDGSTYDPLGPDAVEPVVLTPEQRREAMFKAFFELEKREVRGDFNAQGLPNIKPLSAITGFEADTKERNEAWQAYREAKAE